MTRWPTIPGRFLLIVGSLLAVSAATLAPAQPRRARARTASSRRQAQNPPIQFGDVVISNFESARVTLGVSAEASGPDTTVDANDPKQNTKGRLQADKLTAYIVPKTNNQVDRVEAIGSVRFNGSRPAAQGGSLSLRATGSRGTYYRQKRLLVLQGPVTYFAEQPSADGKGRDTVNGTAEKATYDDDKRVLTLSGSVKATVVTPQTPTEGSAFSGDEVRIDMSTTPYTVYIDNTSLKGRVNIRLKEQEKKP